MVLKLYYDLLSQPSRTLYILLKKNKIPFQACPVNLRQGEHLTEDFKEKFNRFQKVPFIHDNDFVLSESIAIVRYLAREYELEEHWYPKNSKQQALIDEYLEWQQHNTRLVLAMYTKTKFIMPMITGKDYDRQIVSKYEKSIHTVLDQIEDLWLANKDYICGNSITVADLFAATEIEQPRIAGFDTLNNRPKLGKWINRVRTELEPFYSEAHIIVNKLADKGKSKL